VIGLLGDGSAMYSIQGLWTAAELGLPVVFIIINNHGYYGLVEFARHFKLAKLPGTQLPHLDFCALARGHGIRAQRVERCEDLDAALTSAFAATQPVLLEVCIAVHEEADRG
jgi:benzoylformate decarboxylase